MARIRERRGRGLVDPRFLHRVISDTRGGKHFARNSTDNSFPLQFGGLEVQEEGELQAGDREVANHLGEVEVIEGHNHFWIGDD